MRAGDWVRAGARAAGCRRCHRGGGGGGGGTAAIAVIGGGSRGYDVTAVAAWSKHNNCLNPTCNNTHIRLKHHQQLSLAAVYNISAVHRYESAQLVKLRGIRRGPPIKQPHKVKAIFSLKLQKLQSRAQARLSRLNVPHTIMKVPIRCHVGISVQHRIGLPNGQIVRWPRCWAALVTVGAVGIPWVIAGCARRRCWCCCCCCCGQGTVVTTRSKHHNCLHSSIHHTRVCSKRRPHPGLATKHSANTPTYKATKAEKWRDRSRPAIVDAEIVPP